MNRTEQSFLAMIVALIVECMFLNFFQKLKETQEDSWLAYVISWGDLMSVRMIGFLKWGESSGRGSIMDA